MLIIEIGLTIWAAYKGYKWLAVLPLVIGFTTVFFVGVIDPSINSIWFDLCIIVILLKMIINGKKGNKTI
jgi:hypothetical protein